MDSHAATAHAESHTESHATHHSDYVKVWAVLCVLLVVSIVGPFAGIKIVTLITAFGVAGVKASMVIHYFMHLTHERHIVHYFLATAVVFMILLFAGVSPDVMKHDGANWQNVAAKQEIERAEAAHAAGGDHHGSSGHEAAPGHDEAGGEGDHGGHEAPKGEH